MPGFASHRGYPLVYLSLIITFLLLSPIAIFGQGNGRSSTGTGGIHTIQGYIFFPSGRRAEGTIIVKLQTYNSGEITVIPDSSGAFTFTSLAPGNYTVVVQAGDDYEIAQENVYFDSDVNLARTGARVPAAAQRQTVMIHLQPKAGAPHAKAGVINAELAEVPDKARKLYERGLEESRAGEASKAIESLKEAISVYPKFPLALNELGVQYLKLGQTGSAVEALKTAVKLNAEAFTPKLNLGIALLEDKQFAAAEQQLRDAVTRNSSAPTAHMYLGLSLVRLDKYDEAERELLLAVEGSGDRLGMAQYYLGGIYWKKHNYSKAADALEAYLRLTPNAPDAERVRATIRDLRVRTPE
jgi:tetratricopeptide (TPR) repeat protein